MKKYITTLLIALSAGYGGAALFFYSANPIQPAQQLNTDSLFRQVKMVDNESESSPLYKSNISMDAPDGFAKAAERSTGSVVYIRNITEQNYASSYFDFLFGGGSNRQLKVSSGSGVIYSSDGYIITNNHVVESATSLEVIYDKRTYPAEIIGKDPNTDLAVLKIDANNLPAIPLGSSRSVNVGEWVLAVGNPFNLTSTVTAGIVSAKGREINILQSKFPIESFIQTDAAINPGNSGGALVNTEGELVGINTAILSRTGSYTGYGFAVPIDIAHKIADDLIQYGVVQKAFLGADVSDLTEDLANRLNVDQNDLSGVVITYLQEEGAAARGGLREGDVILSINGIDVESRSEFEEEMSYRSPGDKITITYRQDGKIKTDNFVLTNREGTTGIVENDIITSKLLGADLEKVSKVELDRLGLEYGVRVQNIKSGLISQMRLGEEFIIARINKVPIDEPEQLKEILENIEGRVIIEGFNARGRYERHVFFFR